MLKWLRDRFWRRRMREFEFSIIYPQGGKLRDHRVWATDAREARLMVMLCYDTGVFIIGPATEIN